MNFWIAAALMSGIVVGFILLALRREIAAQDPAKSDIQVYKDQLREVERDLARGTVNADEAEGVRLEVSRRLLEADKKARAEARDAPRAATIAAGVFAAVVLLGGSFGLYSWVGAPGYPDLPLEARLDAAETARLNRPSQEDAETAARELPRQRVEVDPSFEDLIDQLRVAVTERPDDLQGALLLARNEAVLGNFIAAHEAQGRALTLFGPEIPAAAWADYVDMLVLAAGGYVSPRAEDAINRTLEGDPGNGTARYYTGLLAVQTGRPDVAFRVWDALLRRSQEDDPWVVAIRAQIEELAQVAGERSYVIPETGQDNGPSAEDIANAATLTPAQRIEMIQGMVGGLAERLAREGGPPEDWARLITSLGAIGDQGRALIVAEEAVIVFADDPDALLTIYRARERVGLQ